MDLKFAKALGAELASKLPWQEIADSPTVRYYTEWSKFEGYKPLEIPAPLPGEAGPCKIVLVDGALAAVGRCSGVEVGAAADVFHNVQINSKILALHASALRAAVRITITGQVEPLVVVMSASAKGAHTASHVVIEAEPSAAGSVVVYAEAAEGAMHTAVVEGRLGGDLEYVLVSRGGGPQYVHSALAVEKSVAARPLAFGGVMNSVREEYVIGEGASAEVVGLELGVGDSRIDHVVSVINDAPRGRGFARLYAVAADRSFVTQRAVGRITKRGAGGNSAVEGVVYIAGDGAVANTQPVILVETGDVEGARHSAADAALDEDREFFLRARGVRKDDLPKLLMLSLVDQYLSSLSETARGVVEPLLKPLFS
ncbi:SufD family Fe-S cluster assembly protein [Pyrobaculum sp.]|uniref:SufB/SufD family protein n=1 Tax=Pyrobaculum sp. TaxID=2004705 RepID=UPI0031661258